MALTIGIEGLGVIANADNATTDTASSGSWGFNGSGGVSNGVTTDTFYFGSASVAMALSGAGKNGWLYYQHPSAINFSTTYAGQYIYIWVHCPTLGLSETLANVGLGIRIGTDTSNYRTYTVAGNDDSNGWDGRWKCFVIDPTLTGSITDTGTYSASTVTYIGIKGQTTATAKGDNFFVSQIAVGSGLRITGTSTTGWKEVIDYCVDLPNRAWGMAQEREGIYYLYGHNHIGDTVQSADTSFVDSNRILQFGVSEYYISAAWATSLPVTAFGIEVQDHASWKTTFTDGVIVGTDKGRSGSTIIGGVNEDVIIDLYGGNNAASVTAMYGTKFQDISGSLNSGNDAQHAFLSVSFIACAQFDPVGAPLIRNCVFAETTDTVAGLKWNASIDIDTCSFIANTTGAAIEHTDWNGTESGTVTTADATGVVLHDSAGTFLTDVAIGDIVYNETDLSFATVVTVDSNIQITTNGLAGGTDDQFASSDAYSITTPYTYANLLFSGNTNDIDNTTSPANVVAISKTGTSNPITYPTGDFVTIQGAVTIAIQVIDEAKADIQNAQTSIYLLDAPYTQLMNEDTLASGLASESYTGATPIDIKWRVRKSETTDNPRYISQSGTGQIGTGGFSLTVTMKIQTKI